MQYPEGTTEGTVVQLVGEERERARRLAAQAQEALRQARGHLEDLGVLVTSKATDARTASFVEFRPPVDLAAGAGAADDDGGSVTVTYYDEDGRCIEVWQDPPGVCRPCHDDKPGPMSPGPILVTLKAF